MKILRILPLVFAVVLFSCVSPEKPVPPAEKPIEEEKIEGDEEPEKTKIEEKAEEKQARADFSNGAWLVRGENGAQCIENAEIVEVQGARGARAVIRVHSENRIAVSLEGFGGTNAVNTWSTQFSVSVKDSYDIEFVLTDTMRDGRLIFNPSNSELVNDLLHSGGALEFLLTNDENPSEQYSFVLENPEGSYDDAFAELKARDIAD